MTTEIFLTSLRKLANVGLERTPPAAEPAAEAKAAARTEPATTLADVDAETFSYSLPDADDVAAASSYQGLPPPVSPSVPPVMATLLLNAIINRIEKPPVADPKPKVQNDALPPSRTTTTDVEVRPNIGVVETVYVDGVPKASAVISTDDRAHLVSDMDPTAKSGSPDHPPTATTEDAVGDRGAQSIDPAIDRLRKMDDQLTPSLRDLQGALGGMPVAQHDMSAISSFVFNAAMIPGWPAALPLQPGQRAEARNGMSAEERAELIAKLMAEMGIEPLTEAELREMRRKPSSRLLRRIAVILSAILVSLSAVAQDLLDWDTTNGAIEDARQHRPGAGGTRKRLYLE